MCFILCEAVRYRFIFQRGLLKTLWNLNREQQAASFWHYCLVWGWVTGCVFMQCVCMYAVCVHVYAVGYVWKQEPVESQSSANRGEMWARHSVIQQRCSLARPNQQGPFLGPTQRPLCEPPSPQVWHQTREWNRNERLRKSWNWSRTEGGGTFGWMSKLDHLLCIEVNGMMEKYRSHKRWVHSVTRPLFNAVI